MSPVETLFEDEFALPLTENNSAHVAEVKTLPATLDCFTDKMQAEALHRLSIAFVSINKSQLEAFMKRAYFQVMETNGLFTLSQVIKVPDSCHNVQFIRNQNVEKIFVGGRKRILARVKRRAEARGEIFQPQIPTQTTDVGFFHCIFMQSITSGQNYVLYIQKQSCDGIKHGHYSSYGLASNNIYTGYVPELSGVI